jgi:hypothetical protein
MALKEKLNALIDEFLRSGGSLTEITAILGVNSSTLWRYRSSGCSDPYACYLIAKLAGKSEEESLAFASQVHVANGGNPDAPLRQSKSRLRRSVASDEVRRLVHEEIAKLLGQKSA